MNKQLALIAGLAAFLFSYASGAGAASFRVTLNDGTELVGVVKSFEDGVYRITTTAGERTINADTVRGMEVMQEAALQTPEAAGAAGAAPEAVPEPEFTILTGDAQMVVGRLVSFEDGVYEIATASGEVRIPVDKVEKIEIAWMKNSPPGAAKPSAGGLPAGAVRLVGSVDMSEAMAPAMLESFVESNGGRDMRWSRGTVTALRVLSASAKGQGKFTAELRIRPSAAAVDGLIRGEGDIAMMSRRMTPEEASRISAANLGEPLSPQQEKVVAPGAAIVVVNPANPIKELRLDQIADIFSGRYRNWSDVGGAPRRIQLYVPAEGAGTLSVFQKQALKNTALLETAEKVASDVEMAEIVSSDPAAIGIVEFSHAGNAHALSIVDECGVSHAASPFTVSTEQYPLSTKLYFYTTRELGAPAAEFVDFVLSDEGQKRLADRGLLSLMPSVDVKNNLQPSPSTTSAAQKTAAEQKIAADLARLANAASRVSIVFRFNFGASDLDAKGDADIQRLADFLNAQKAERRRVALVGFSDGSGPLENNVKLSERRSKTVAQKLAQKGVTADLVVGFGALLPIACGVSPEAAVKNRRVEAWLY